MSHLLMSSIHVDLLIDVGRCEDIVVEVGPFHVLNAVSILPTGLDRGGNVRVMEEDFLVV